MVNTSSNPVTSNSCRTGEDRSTTTSFIPFRCRVAQRDQRGNGLRIQEGDLRHVDREPVAAGAGHGLHTDFTNGHGVVEVDLAGHFHSGAIVRRGFPRNAHMVTVGPGRTTAEDTVSLAGPDRGQASCCQV
jgi:hypothetical protein